MPVVFLLYWLVFNRSGRLRNGFLLAASYLFYGWWDWRFLLLIAFSSLVDFTVARRMGGAGPRGQRKFLLALSLAVNLGLLGFFKYYNFFAESFTEAFTLLGSEFSVARLNLILPVGISFYTFQTLSYTIDVYRGNLEPTRDPVEFLAFVSFFPQLVAGPIERAGQLLPQFATPKTFDYGRAVDGMRQILIGLFKKVVVADNCAVLANDIFNNYGDYSGSTLVLGAAFFAVQIYGDFSGYSDIAIGTARLLGFDLMRNFAYPYFSRDVAEFWRRWHISLTTWFRDYIYIPLGGSRGSRGMKVRNVMIIFLVSGFWHGANWTFIVWGLLNAIYFLPLLLADRNRAYAGETVAAGRALPSLTEVGQMTATFLLITLAWVFFRSPTVTDAVAYLGRVVSPSLLSVPEVGHYSLRELAVVPMIGLLTVIEWVGRTDQHGLERLGLGWPRAGRWALYLLLVGLLMVLGGREQTFIYFQF